MLLYIVGAPRSGKSYFAVDYIFKHHKDKVSKNVNGKIELVSKYNKVLTNIGGFKHNLIDNCEKLNIDNLDIILKDLYSLYKDNKNESNLDDILIDFLKSKDMYKILLVIDEAHNYFDRRLQHLIFFLSYHGHLGFDILLITQNLSLIDSKYKAFAEYFVKALPTTMRITKKNFRYLLFTCSSMTKNCKFASETIKFNKQVFNLYKSGDKVNTKSMFRNIFIGLSILLILMFYFFYTSPVFNSKNPDEHEVDKNLSSYDINNSHFSNTKNVVLSNNKNSSKNLSDDYVYFQFRCLRYFDTCSGLDYIDIPTSLFLDFLLKFDVKPINSKKYPHSIKYYFFSDPNIFSVFKQYEVKNDHTLQNDNDNFSKPDLFGTNKPETTERRQ